MNSGYTVSSIGLVFLIQTSQLNAQTSQAFACSKETVRIGNNIGEREVVSYLGIREREGEGKNIIFQVYTQ